MMKTILKTILIIVIPIVYLNCNPRKKEPFNAIEVYKSKELTITQVAENSFIHTSLNLTDELGNISCNGLIVRSEDEAVVFDTAINNSISEELIKWIEETLHCNINAIIPTHFHNDSLGGLKAFDEKNIPSYANLKTIELAKKNNYFVPKNGFKDSLILKIGHEKVIAKFLGEGHAKDNIIGYFPSENIMFGGCLVRELDANKGYLGDANVADWPNTIRKLKNNYPNVNIVVPGHGDYGNKKLLDYTFKLFRNSK